MRPNISPLSTVNDNSDSAGTAPYRFVTRLNSMTAMGSGPRNLRFDGHPRLQHALTVVGGDFDAIDQLRPLLSGLDVSRRELRLRRDEGDRAVEPLARVGHQGERLPQAQLRHDRL